MSGRKDYPGKKECPSKVLVDDNYLKEWWFLKNPDNKILPSPTLLCKLHVEKVSKSIQREKSVATFEYKILLLALFW